MLIGNGYDTLKFLPEITESDLHDLGITDDREKIKVRDVLLSHSPSFFTCIQCSLSIIINNYYLSLLSCPLAFKSFQKC